LVIFLVTPIPIFADHVPTQPPYNQSIALDSSTGDLTIGIYSSDGFEDSPPEKYTIWFTISDSALDTSSAFCISTSFGHGQNLTWQYHVFKLDDLKTYFESPYGTFRTRIRSDNDTDNSYSSLTDEMSIVIPNQEPFVGSADWSEPSVSCVDSSISNSTTSSSTTSSSTTSSTTTTSTTSTTLPKAEDVVEDGVTTYLAWDDKGCEHPNNPLSYKEYLSAIETGLWFGFQSGDCEKKPEPEVIIENENEKPKTEVLDVPTETKTEGEDLELEDEVVLSEDEIEKINREAEEKAEQERLAAEQLEKDNQTKEELETSGILENFDDEESVDEFVDAIQKIEEETDFENFEMGDEIVEVITDEIPEVIEIVIEEPEKETEPIKEVFDEDETVDVVDPVEIVEAADIPEIAIVETEQMSEEEVEQIVEEYVEQLETVEVVEIVESVVEAGVEELSEEQVAVVAEVVETAIEKVEELEPEQVETVAVVLGLEQADDVQVIAEAAKTDEAIAVAVDSFVERAVANAEVEDYNFADSVVEVQVEEFLENPSVIFQVDFQEIDLSTLGDDLTNQQKEKAQEVVVPVIIASQIVQSSVLAFRRF
jgi:hypothetical protein